MEWSSLLSFIKLVFERIYKRIGRFDDGLFSGLHMVVSRNRVTLI